MFYRVFFLTFNLQYFVQFFDCIYRNVHQRIRFFANKKKTKFILESFHFSHLNLIRFLIVSSYLDSYQFYLFVRKTNLNVFSFGIKNHNNNNIMCAQLVCFLSHSVFLFSISMFRIPALWSFSCISIHHHFHSSYAFWVFIVLFCSCWFFFTLFVSHWDIECVVYYQRET